MIIDPKKVKPMGKRLVLEIYEGVDKTESGFELVNSQGNSAPVIGTVIRISDVSSYKIGDKIIFRKYAVDSINYQSEDGEKKVYILEEDDVLGVIEQ